MSRVVVYGLTGKAEGELQATVNRGWAVNDGGSATMTLSAEVAANPWIQLGRVVTIDHPDLPVWAGVIDTPWKAGGPPVVTLYDIPYLLSMRAINNQGVLSGNTLNVVPVLIESANFLGDLGFRVGAIVGVDFAIGSIDGKSIWEILVDMAKVTGLEISFKPVVDSGNQLLIYVDLLNPVSVVTQVLLEDGAGGNIEISDAVIDGKIINYLIGTSDESTLTSRKRTNVYQNESSIGLYRLRNSIKTFKGISTQTQLEEYTCGELARSKQPTIKIIARALDKGNLFANLRIGNIVTVRGTRLILPGGVSGWSGQMRISGMSYDEERNQVEMLLEAPL